MKNFFILLLLLLQLGLHAENYSGYASYIPAGSPISVTLNENLGSEFSQVGDKFTASLASPLYAGNQIIAETGSIIEGLIVGVEKAGRAGKPGSLELRLVNIITKDSRAIPLQASFDHQSFKLQADGGRLANFSKGAAAGAATGALSGLVGAAIGGGRLGKTTAIGTGIGAGTGLLVAGFKKGQGFILEKNSALPFKLDSPVQAPNQAPSPQQFRNQGFADPVQQQQYNPYL